MWKVFKGGVRDASNRVLKSWFMIILQDTYQDPNRGQILTTIVTPSASALVGVRRGELWEHNLLDDFSCLISGSCS